MSAKLKSSNLFLQQKDKGDIGELITIDLFKKHEFICYKESDNKKRSFYDLVLKYKNWSATIEVKYDIKASITQNVLIEFCNIRAHKNSGITITQANFWIYIIKYNRNNAVYITSVDRLRCYIDSVKPKSIRYGAIDSNSAYLLYDSIILKRIFYRIDDITTQQLKQILYRLDFTYEF